jgi:hypothetical protein
VIARRHLSPDRRSLQKARFFLREARRYSTPDSPLEELATSLGKELTDEDDGR